MVWLFHVWFVQFWAYCQDEAYATPLSVGSSEPTSVVHPGEGLLSRQTQKRILMLGREVLIWFAVRYEQ